MTRNPLMLLHHSLERTVRRSPEKTALVWGAQRLSYAEVGASVHRLAVTLQRCGVHRGDRVAIFTDNRVEAVLATYAALEVGAAFMPISGLTKQDKLAFFLSDAEPTCLVTSEALSDVYQVALARSPSVRTCIVADMPAGNHGAAQHVLSFAEAVAQGTGTLTDPGTIDQDLAALIYTSGSTGEPKGVMLTHLNMTTAAASVLAYLDLRADDVILAVLPLAFSYGLYQFLMGFQVGATVVLERSFAFPVKTLEVMQREGVTVFPGVPTMFSTLLKLTVLPRYDLRRLRMITSAAAALSEEHIRALRTLFPHATLFSMYGLTECKRVTYLPPEDLDRRPTSVGRGMPNQEVWLVDEAGNRLPNGSVGELVIRGNHVMRGYWKKPEETAKRLKPGPYPGEMVLHSGDLFRTDADGFLYFLGRMDQVFKSRGEKVSPREVENVLYGIDGVVDAGVVGVPDELLGQAVKAFVVLRPGCHLTEQDIIQHCLAKLENFMAPKCVAFIDELARTDSGKIRTTGLS